MKLHLGCGTDYRNGWINVNLTDAVPCDVVADLNKFPWPFPDASADEVLAAGIFEHLFDGHKTMLELGRVMKPGATAKILVPYAFCSGAVDPLEHHSFWTDKSLDYFCGVHRYPGTPVLFKMMECKLSTCKVGWRNKTRNLMPFRSILRHFLLNMYDGVEFIIKRI